jgi:hypothetical protein
VGKRLTKAEVKSRRKNKVHIAKDIPKKRFKMVTVMIKGKKQMNGIQ